MRITLIPSRHTLEVSDGETILETCRRLGEPISYSCVNGRCGLCRCFVSIPGEQPSLLSPNFSTSDFRECLACQTVPSSDCLLKIPDQNEPVVLPARIEKGIVSSIEPLNDSIVRLKLAIKRPIEHRRGQHFELSFPRDLKRQYSASTDGNPNEQKLVFDIQIHPYGIISNHVRTTLRVGDHIRIRGPLGSAYLRKNSRSNLLLIASGTGLGAMISLMSEIAEAQMPNSVYVYAAHTLSEQAYGRTELKRAAAAIKGLRKCVVAVASGPRQRGDHHGLLTDVIAQDLESLSGCDAYLFGSPIAIESCVRMLLARKMNPGQIHAVPYQYAEK